MSQRKRKANNKPSLSAPLTTTVAPSSLHLTSFHPSKPLYAVASTAIGQHVIRLYDCDWPVPGGQEARSEIRLKKDENVSLLAWANISSKGKRRKEKTELLVGLTNGKIYVIEQALGEIVKTLDGHTAAVRAWAVDGEKGWTCGNDSKLRLWDLQADTCLQTVSPEVEGTEFSSLALSNDHFFCSAAETLYQLSKSDGKIVSQVVPHMMPIHTIQYSADADIVVTAAVGDRFINIFSYKGTSLNRLGSLTCTHDVRSFIILKSTLLAITTLGTLEVFNSFYSDFDTSKKGGLTKPPSATVQLTTSHKPDIQIQDVTPQGEKIVISWIEGAKLGFETMDINSISGKVEVNVETRQEQAHEQTSKPYDETNAIVSVGKTETKDSSHDTDLSFDQRLSQLQSLHTSKEIATRPSQQAIIPSGASSLSVVLTQALNSSDEKLLQSCFNQRHDAEAIHNTLIRLSPSLVPSLLNYFNSLLSHKQKRANTTFDWIREAIVIHGAYLVSQGDEVRDVLVRLKSTLDRRGQSWERLTRLKGRLEMLKAIRQQQKAGRGREPEVIWTETREEEEEPEIEDVRYLMDNGDDEDEDMAESEEEDEVVGLEDIKMTNGVDSEEEESDEESVTAAPKKVNGISHDSDDEESDSDDSALDLDDLIDDEASEASDEDDEESAEDEEDDAEEEADIPPSKKAKLR